MRRGRTRVRPLRESRTQFLHRGATRAAYCAAGGVAEPAAPSPSRPSRIFLRTSWAADLISCIFLRTRVPAALLPPMALFTSSSASATSCFSVSYSCIDASESNSLLNESKNDTNPRKRCQTMPHDGVKSLGAFIGRFESCSSSSEICPPESKLSSHLANVLVKQFDQSPGDRPGLAVADGAVVDL